MYITLEEIKKHLNIDDYFTDDDAYLNSLIQVAAEVVERHIDDKLIDLCELDENGEVDLKSLPSPLIHAMKLFIGNMYANRESIAFAQSYELPLSYNYLLSLYKNYEGRTT